MKVQELIDALSKEEPSAAVWIQLDNQNDRFANLMPLTSVLALGDEFVNQDANEEDVVIRCKAKAEAKVMVTCPDCGGTGRPSGVNPGDVSCEPVYCQRCGGSGKIEK